MLFQCNFPTFGYMVDRVHWLLKCRAESLAVLNVEMGVKKKAFGPFSISSVHISMIFETFAVRFMDFQIQISELLIFCVWLCVFSCTCVHILAILIWNDGLFLHRLWYFTDYCGVMPQFSLSPTFTASSIQSFRNLVFTFWMLATMYLPTSKCV